MTKKEFDGRYFSDKVNLLAGVDEAGRGPVAGPVVAAAVIFDKETFIPDIGDSKKISEKKREELYDEIYEKALAVGVGIVSVDEIEKINILNAALKAMKLAVKKLNIAPDFILIDGNKTFECSIPTECVVKGDDKSFAIGAASIVAKVTRDRIMRELDLRFPQYFWKKNKGYGTKEHVEAIKKYGVSEHHRKSFLRKILAEQESLF